MNNFLFLFLLTTISLFGCIEGCITPTIADNSKSAIEASFKTADAALSASFKALNLQLDAYDSTQQDLIEQQKKIHNLNKFNSVQLLKIATESEKLLKIVLKKRIEREFE